MGDRAAADAAPGPGVGLGSGGVRPGPVQPGAGQGPAGARVQAVRYRGAGLHRAPVRAARGDPGARPAAAPVRPARRAGVPAAGAGTADHEARGVPAGAAPAPPVNRFGALRVRRPWGPDWWRSRATVYRWRAVTGTWSAGTP